MPCRSDYLEVTQREKELRRAAILGIWLDQQLGIPSPAWRFKAANDPYCRNGKTVTALCKQLKALRDLAPERYEKIVYDAHSREARDLATWWEEHQETDRIREEAEQRKKDRLKKKEEILKKLGISEDELKTIMGN